MTKEEMAKAYAEGFIEEYREIAYDAFLCGYGAKCSLEIPKDLEEAAKEFAKNAYLDKHNLVWMFKRGAKWQKEQMMKEAVDGEVDFEYFGYKVIRPDLKQLDTLLESMNHGDKVRIIIVKED